ncbi:MAG: pitrilysin family protein [Halanaerobiales bacterium]|nr:pitrilysin family protein [Halanaerobiales bacterium]
MIYKKFESINEEYYEKEFDSGLNVILIPRNKYNKKQAILSVDVGSVDLKIEDKNNKIQQYPKGIAHFMEHMLFENREGSIIDRFSEIGSSVNAYTGFNNTNYYFNTTSDFYLSLKYLFDFVLNPHFEKERIDHEKNVINQEINMYQDSPGWQSFYQLLQSMFFKYPIKENIAGTPESISKINKSILIKFFEKFYSLNNMTLVVIGKISPNKLFDWVEDNYSKLVSNKINYKKIYPKEPKGIKIKEKDLAMSISRPIVSIGFKEDNPYRDNLKIIQQDMVTNMTMEMIFGKSSSNYHDLYNQNLIDENFSFNYMREKNTGFAKIYAETSQINETISGIENILNNWGNNYDEKEFEIIKNKYIGRYFRSLNSFENLSSQIIKYSNLNYNYLNILDTMRDIKINDIIKQYNSLFKNKNHVKILIKKIKK